MKGTFSVVHAGAVMMALVGAGSSVIGPASASASETAVEIQETTMYPALATYLEARAKEFNQIPEDRKAMLETLADYVREAQSGDGRARLNFVCTHNSRRSHMSQLWAAAAAKECGLKVTTYSGGTEATAFNPRAVASLTRAGFRIEKTCDDKNSIYHVRMSDGEPAMTCFSKRWDNPPNPTESFAAVMVCTEADEACPFVAGAQTRIALPFTDPKVSDGTDAEAATYDERSAQIAREMLYVMRKAKS